MDLTRGTTTGDSQVTPSNGVITMSGGTVVVSGPTGNGNGAIDAGSFDISDGLLLAAGSAGMAESPEASSSQASVNLMFSSTQNAGTVIQMVEADGKVVFTFEAEKSFQSLVFSSEDVVSGATYDVYVDAVPSGDSLGGLYAEGGTGGTEIGSITAG